MSSSGARAVRVQGQVPSDRDRCNTLPELPILQLDREVDEITKRRLAESECAVIDGSAPDALGIARRVHAGDPSLQVVLVAPEERREQLQHAMLFAPGLGELWITTPAEMDPQLLERAGAITRQRRAYEATRVELERGFTSPAPDRLRRTRISDAFLAAVLHSVPDPVISVDAAGAVLSWSPSAERVLGLQAADAIGKPLPDLVSRNDPAPLRELLAADRERPTGREVRFLRADGEEGTAEVTLAQVSEAEAGIRVVILHDVTESRRIQAELETQAGELEEQAAELEALNDELQQRGEELASALATRARFYAAMSHELRTPINAIMGYNSLLLEGIYGPLAEEQERGLTRSQRAARHLLELVNDVLDLAKVEAGRIDLTPEPTRFPQLAEELLDTVRSLAEQHGSSLVLRGEGTHTILTDPRRARQILLNLLSNAIRFGGGNPIEICWEPTSGGGVELRVVDRGIGISPADIDRIFDEFEQVEPLQEGGTGLGLSISRRLAELLGGALSVQSKPGEGSTFSLLLPAKLPEGTQAPSST